jgi:hypothetical protein
MLLVAGAGRGCAAEAAGFDLTKFGRGTPCPALKAAADAAAVSLAGISPPGGTNLLQPGDSLTALVDLHQKGGRETQWLLSLRAEEPGTPAKGKTNSWNLVMYSCIGTRLEFPTVWSSAVLRTFGPFSLTDKKAAAGIPPHEPVRLRLNEGWLSLGMDQGAAAMYRTCQSETNKSGRHYWFRSTPLSNEEVDKNRKVFGAAPYSFAEEHALAGTWPAMFSYFEIIQNTSDLEAILKSVIDRPSLWSILTHGVSINFVPEPEKIAPADPSVCGLAPDTTAYCLPMKLEINGRPGLNIVFVVASPRPPLLLCGGIVGVLAEKPNDDSTWLTFRVLSAQRGTAVRR